MKNTLSNILCGFPLVITTLLPINKANAQLTKINNPTKREQEGKPRLERPNYLYYNLQINNKKAILHGIGYRKRISEKFGLNASIAKGNNYHSYVGKIDGYTKASFGAVYFPPKEKPKDFQVYFGINGSINRLKEKPLLPENIHTKVFNTFSAEGYTGFQDGHLSTSFGYDPFLNAGIITFGLVFGKKDKSP